MREEPLKVYNSIVDLCTEFERKGKKMIYTSANEYMFALLNKNADISIRFSKKRQEAFIKKNNTKIYKSYGAVMKGYVLFSDELLKDQKIVAKYMNESYDYVMPLPSKQL